MKLTEEQKYHLKIINEVLNIIPNNYVLKGGTALLLDYNLDRFSEDIDLDYIINNKPQTTLKNAIIKYCNQHNYEYHLKKDTNAVLRIVIKYNKDRILKIEASSRNIVNQNEYDISNNGNYNVYNLIPLSQKKLEAFLNRDKFRDLFDINFLINQNVFNQSQLIQINQRFNEKGDILYQRELENDAILNNNIDLDNFLFEFITNLETKLNQTKSIKRKI